MDVGLIALARIFELLRIDEPWVVRRPRGFTWVAHRLAQSVDASEPLDSYGRVVSPVVVRVPVVEGVQIGTDEVDLLLGKLNADAVGSALVYWPEERRIESVLAHTVYEQTLEHRIHQLAHFGMLQLRSAEAQADWLAQQVQGSVALWRHPESGERSDPGEVLNLNHRFISASSGESRYASRLEMDTVSEAMQKVRYPSADMSVVVEETATGLTITVPLGSGEVAQIELNVLSNHPWLGAGLAVTTRLPMNVQKYSASKLGRIAGRLNRDQLADVDGAGAIGAWALIPGEGSESLSWARFLPNALFQQGAARDAAYSEIERVDWVSRVLFSARSGLSAQQILTRQLGEMHGKGRAEIQRIARDEEAWASARGAVFMTWGIFNPSGPTLNCVGVRKTADPDVDEIFYRWMHFLEAHTYRLGTVDVSAGRAWDQVIRALERAFSVDPTLIGTEEAAFHMVSCIPSFVTHEFPEQIGDLPEHLLQISRAVQQADWGREIYYLGKYGGRLYSRAGEELRESAQEWTREDQLLGVDQHREAIALLRARYAAIPSFAETAVVDYDPRPFVSPLFARWWATISTPEFLGDALGEFAQAWVGAIHQAREFQPAVVRFEDVRDFLSRFGHPLWPDEFTTELLSQTLGLE